MRHYKVRRLMTVKFMCVSVCVCWHATGHNFVKSSVAVPRAASKREQREKVTAGGGEEE